MLGFYNLFYCFNSYSKVDPCENVCRSESSKCKVTMMLSSFFIFIGHNTNGAKDRIPMSVSLTYNKKVSFLLGISWIKIQTINIGSV